MKSTHPSLVLIGLHDFLIQTVRHMREAWKRETYVRSQSFSSEWAVKYLHVGRKKIQISLPPGEQDQSNALPQGQQRQSNPHPMPPSPRRLYIDRCINLSSLVGVRFDVIQSSDVKVRYRFPGNRLPSMTKLRVLFMKRVFSYVNYNNVYGRWITTQYLRQIKENSRLNNSGFNKWLGILAGKELQTKKTRRHEDP